MLRTMLFGSQCVMSMLSGSQCRNKLLKWQLSLRRLVQFKVAKASWPCDGTLTFVVQNCHFA